MRIHSAGSRKGSGMREASDCRRSPSPCTLSLAVHDEAAASRTSPQASRCMLEKVKETQPWEPQLGSAQQTEWEGQCHPGCPAVPGSMPSGYLTVLTPGLWLLCSCRRPCGNSHRGKPRGDPEKSRKLTQLLNLPDDELALPTWLPITSSEVPISI